MEKRQQSGLRFQQAAQWLFDAHGRRERFRPLPAELAPRSTGRRTLSGCAVALRAGRLGAIGGYKIAVVAADAALLAASIRLRPGRFANRCTVRQPAARAATMRLIVKFEVAFEIGEALPAADAPFSRSGSPRR